MAKVPGKLPILAVLRPFKGWVCIAVILSFGLDSLAFAVVAPPALEPAYWKQRLFLIPYQVNKTNTTKSQIAKVQLLLSRDGTTGWRTLQEATPEVRGFGYHAPEDGEYWFALRHLDQQGRPWPSAAIQAQMRVRIDTAKPQLKIDGVVGDSGRIELRYESLDANLRPESLVVEAREAGGKWSKVPLGPPDSSQADRLEGRATWTFPHNALRVEIRASISDKAGHHVEASNELAVGGPALQMPLAASGPSLLQKGDKTLDPFQAAQQLGSRDWPASNRVASRLGVQANSAPAQSRGFASTDSPPKATPPLQNPYTVARNTSSKSQTVAQLLGESMANSAARGPSESLRRLPPIDNNGWAPPLAESSRLNDRMVNSLSFDVEYDLQSVGPWGVSKVELWGTHDHGQTWQSYTVDSDNRSPVRVTVPGEGVYGFRILVDGANGVGATPPRSGEQPELIVAVDLQAPRVKLLSTELGKANLAEHLLLRWSVEDRNLERRPIGLFYSAYPNGPWSTVAAGLENTGTYTWRLQRHMPDKFYIRLEARDMAGNLATHQSEAPIVLTRSQPTGRLRSVHAVDTPSGF